MFCLCALVLVHINYSVDSIKHLCLHHLYPGQQRGKERKGGEERLGERQR